MTAVEASAVVCGRCGVVAAATATAAFDNYTARRRPADGSKARYRRWRPDRSDHTPHILIYTRTREGYGLYVYIYFFIFPRFSVRTAKIFREK